MGVRLGERSYVIFKPLFELGGKATSKEIFDMISVEDKQKFNLKDRRYVGAWLNTKSGLYINKLHRNPYPIKGGHREQVYMLNDKVMKFFQEENDNTQ